MEVPRHCSTGGEAQSGVPGAGQELEKRAPAGPHWDERVLGLLGGWFGLVETVAENGGRPPGGRLEAQLIRGRPAPLLQRGVS